ncbi:MAG: hypothetical protein ACRDMX_06575 [Solirubrobacteraceae bacterium]
MKSNAGLPTREQVTGLLAQGHSCETAARKLGIPAGLAYMIATGIPADGSAVVDRGSHTQSTPPARTQGLANPPAVNPTRDQQVIEWVRRRAADEGRGRV